MTFLGKLRFSEVWSKQLIPISFLIGSIDAIIITQLSRGSETIQ